MVKSSVKTVTYTSGSRRANAARSTVAKARQILRSRMVAAPRAPLRTGGFYGVYNRRGRDELKFVDAAVSFTAWTTAGAIAILNGVAQGTDYNQRIGRSTLLKSILFRISVGKSANNSTGSTCRFLIFYDAQTNGAAPAVTDVLAAASYLSPMNLNNRDRFKILCDTYIDTEAYTADPIATGTFKNETKTMFKKFNMECQFSGTGATVGSIATGGIFILLISDEANTVGYEFYSRIRYTDK